jgi:GTP-binding protein EngB required for normal cell division
MLRWLKGDANRTKEVKAFCTVTEGLQRIYKEKILPVERETDYHWFFSPELTDADFASRPMVLLIGQYSTGKSTFIRHLLGRDYPGLRIGPEPTTDKFVAVVHGDQDQVIPGNALVVDKSMPFTQLSHFGNSFLSRFECAKLNSPVLEGISLIDSPGVLAGEKQRVNRGYEFEAVTKWFADRVDMILVLFDVSKLDISDEFRRVLLAIKGNDHKIHMVLNKADRVTTPQLMRVYGAMMWSLGKVIDTPEVTRVYIGSFWDEPLTNDEQRRLFESEENELYTALAKLPRGAAVRKLNDLIKRARLAKVHAYIIDYLKRKMPSMFGKGKEKEKLIANLTTHYQEIAKERSISLGDFPDPRMMQEKLTQVDFSKFAKVDKKKLDTLELMLSNEIPKLLALIPEEVAAVSDATLEQVGPEASPFAVMKVGGATELSVYQTQWLVPPNPEEYKADFVLLGPNAAGRITGQKAKPKMTESKLPSNILHKVWTLADADKDGNLTLYEYALAMHFIKMKLDGQDLPATLPANMHPTSVGIG